MLFVAVNGSCPVVVAGRFEMRALLLCLSILVSCASAHAAIEEFPVEMRGFWATKKATCDVLKIRGPGSLRKDDKWLKISATDVLGSEQGQFFRELPIDSVSWPGTRRSIAFQIFTGPALFMGELALTANGRLVDRIIGARAGLTFLRC